MKTIAAAAVEFLGTAVLVCAAVGSGILATELTDNLGLALLMNAVSTATVLALLILLLAPISGAHFNPAVSLAELLRRKLPIVRCAAFVLAQLAGAIAGTALANLMFGHPAFELAGKSRVNDGTLLAEVVATAGLIVAILLLAQRGQSRFAPAAVALWIGSASLFTASTSFANPAVTFGRMFTDSFAGIAPTSVAPFIGAQLVGMLLGLVIVVALGAAERLHSPSEVK